ncbi:hypothetical protein K443DRAFT_72344, partial [Laccaria amethystina LaAM-08-1]
MCTDHVNTTPTFSTSVYIMFLLFFSFLPCKHYSNIFNISYPNIINTFCIMSILFVSIFPDFPALFVLITIFGNVHRPCKYHSNIVNNSVH